MPKLVGNRYGKGRVRVLKILRDGLSQRQIYDVEGNLGPHPWDVVQRDLELYEGSWRLSSRVSVTMTAMGEVFAETYSPSACGNSSSAAKTHGESSAYSVAAK